MNKKEAIIFDIDGTLANCDHRLHYLKKEKKDWDKFFSEMDKDKVNENISILYHLLMHSAIYYFIITGRPQKYEEKTRKWLSDNSFYRYDIFFRANGDFRDDDIIKKEIYEDHIKDKYEVRLVIEDRSRVVKMWRSLGITCLQCADGDF